MAETALQAAYKAIYTKLNNAGNAAARVYPDMADDKATYPNWIYFWSGGGEANQRRRGDANITIAVKCVSKSMNTSFVGSGQISALLNNQGVQDIVTATGAYVSNPLNGGTDWVIKTSTQEDVFHFTELIEQTGETVYHDGAYYRLTMEAK